MFVNGDFLVKDIFGHNYQIDNSEIIGTYHEYGKALPQNTKSQTVNKSIINYVNNSLWILDQRGKALLEECIN